MCWSDEPAAARFDMDPWGITMSVAGAAADADTSGKWYASTEMFTHQWVRSAHALSERTRGQDLHLGAGHNKHNT